jgi:hypothetical protein
MGAKEGHSSSGHDWAAGYHHVMACSRFAGVLKNELFISLIFKSFFGPQQTVDTESDMVV